jgi:hypothetical protein
MYRGNGSRIFPVILVLIIIAIAIAALVSVGRAIFGGGGEQPSQSQTQVDTSRESLLNPAVNHSVRMTVRGPIVADENFRSYQIIASADNRSLTTYSGYLERSIDTKQLNNNVKAYEEFVYALDKAAMAKGEAFTGEKDDTRGICATGKVYEFEILDGSTTVKRLWTSTCKGSQGSLKASSKQLEALFHDQIPERKALLNKIDL